MSDEATIIGPNTVVRGRIAGECDVLVQGRVEGDVTLAGTLTVEATGVIVGNVDAVAAEVAGVVVGDLRLQHRLSVAATAQIRGDIDAASLQVAAGARLSGQVGTSAATTEAPLLPPPPVERRVPQPQHVSTRPSNAPTRIDPPPADPATTAVLRTAKKRMILRTKRTTKTSPESDRDR